MISKLFSFIVLMNLPLFQYYLVLFYNLLRLIFDCMESHGIFNTQLHSFFSHWNSVSTELGNSYDCLA